MTRTQRAWLLPVALSLLLTLLVEGTYVLTEQNLEGRGIFMGQSWSPHDVAQYDAAMDDGEAGELMIHDRLTSEAHAPALIYVGYVLLGWSARPFDLDSDTVYRLAAMAGRVFLLLSLYGATALVSPTPWRRLLAFVLMAIGGGAISLVWLSKALLVPLIGPFDVVATGRDINDPELGTFLVLFTSPHLMVGLGLLLLAALTYARAWTSRGWGSAAWAGLLTFGLSLVNVYSLGTLCPVVTGHALVMTLISRRFVWRGLIAASIVDLAALPMLIYSILTFVVGLDPFWGVAYGRQNETMSPDVLNVIVAFGLLLVAAILGAPTMVRQATPGRVLVLTWIVIAALLMYSPVAVQRRFALGLQPMLAMAASFGLPPVWRAITRERPAPWIIVRPIGIVLTLLGLFGSTLLLTVGSLVLASDAARYQPTEERIDIVPIGLEAAGDWLNEHTGPDDIVLGSRSTGNYLVREMSGRVYLGHWSATVESQRKTDEVHWLFAAPMDPAHLTFLREQGIRYVVLGPVEQSYGAGADLQPSIDGLTAVYDAEDVTIFEVAP